jgi:hypothetical protein
MSARPNLLEPTIDSLDSVGPKFYQFHAVGKFSRLGIRRSIKRSKGRLNLLGRDRCLYKAHLTKPDQASKLWIHTRPGEHEVRFSREIDIRHPESATYLVTTYGQICLSPLQREDVDNDEGMESL